MMPQRFSQDQKHEGMGGWLGVWPSTLRRHSLGWRRVLSRAGLLGRKAVTLMEVLIAIFILAVGLFGVAALLPVGGSEALEAVKADRGVQIGQAALREVQVRKIHHPFQWSSTSGAVVPMWYWNGNTLLTTPEEIEEIETVIQPESYESYRYDFFLIDPVGIAAAQAAGKLPDAKSEWNYFPLSDIRMPRITIRRTPQAAGPMSFKEAWEIFGSQDGNYTWMLMLGPPLARNAFGSTGGDWGFWRGVCSVIVLYKRNLNPEKPPPDTIPIAIQTVTMTPEGGELVLSSADETLRPRLKTNHWVLLLASGSAGDWPLLWAQWYRIVAAGGPPYLANWHVTLSGDPWTYSRAPQHILVMEGVVAVFSQVVEIDWGAGGTLPRM